MKNLKIFLGKKLNRKLHLCGNMKKTKYLIITVLSLVSAAIILAFILQAEQPAVAENDVFTIHDYWELPNELREVSGIAYLQDGKIACVEDENGVIYIYDLADKKIVDRIKFGDNGDYEGIAIKGNDAYVMRSDGIIFEILNYREAPVNATEIQTAFTSYNNIESLTFDAKTNALLIVPKDRDLVNDQFKGVYSMPITSKVMKSMPSMKLDMEHLELSKKESDQLSKNFNPSDLAIHPTTGDIYMVQGKRPFLYIFNGEGKFKKAVPLDPGTFGQPEGITFQEDGILYISNESSTTTANIVALQLKLD